MSRFDFNIEKIKRYFQYSGEETMCSKCDCEKKYGYDLDTFFIDKDHAGDIALRVKCPVNIDTRGYINLLSVDKNKGVYLQDFTQPHMEWLKENFGFKFNEITERLLLMKV